MTLIKAFMHVLLKLASRRDVLHLGGVYDFSGLVLM